MKSTSMKVSTRLTIGFSLLLLLLMVSTGIGLSRMGQIEQRLEKIVNVNNVELNHVLEMRLTVYDRMVAVRNLILMTDINDMRPEDERMKNGALNYDSAETQLNAMIAAEGGVNTEQKAALDAVSALRTIALPLFAKAAELGLQNKQDEATVVLFTEVRPVQRKWLEALGKLIDIEKKQNETAMQTAAQEYASARIVMLAFVALALLVGVIAAVTITRTLMRQLGGEPDYAADIVNRIAAGDLTVQVALRPGDNSSLLSAMDHMRANLNEIVGQVRQGTDTMATASAQIASGNLDLSARTEQQASALEETASSLEELTATVRQNADNARQANALALSSTDIAVKGGSVVSQMITTMSAIDESSKKIADIISVIDGIAFQTNILALNAAVEAARAGEQGRGFAVVATEVRSLAHRSAAAAKQIKLLIDDSVTNVGNGTKLVDAAGQTMGDIVGSVKRVTDIIGEITSASQEQTAGIEQINQAVTQMDEVTQQNAALVEEAAAAAQSLQEQATSLSQMVSVFQVSGGSAAVPKNMAGIARPAYRPAPKALGNSGKSGSANDWEEF
ncbi:methyl-accepting chemotaxis protein [Actimicrobium sp. CCI2.3]|uniref:methyl-accepting chemotaxis protein n=1 Tax=Actimicrobium sp. CCI2.3 TaxID=3048616 RepID=UPI002AB37013|nr:methyl-accepting chemotaxis protein [Actimicrobium sp. CCI2.3]MDY7576177.1 methyl-accepting chemotaxis protein [Actimicrobium sp. CCI2.3]MEB0023972.1 methyl-accepting chemotaxis protein [Actimicrobium sp. CCI2.3]